MQDVNIRPVSWASVIAALDQVLQQGFPPGPAESVLLDLKAFLESDSAWAAVTRLALDRANDHR